MVLSPSHYSVLRLDLDADAAAINAAYEQALSGLPGRRTGLIANWLNERRRAIIERAHQVLSDPTLRAEYDRQLQIDLLLCQYPLGH